jgi:small-conductance mechanosensitive channel
MTIHQIFLDTWPELGSEELTWQALVLAMSLSLAWLLNRLLERNLKKRLSAALGSAAESTLQIVFPLWALAFVSMGQFILGHSQHMGLLKLASTLLLAMAGIRLVVFVLRYVFAPSGWLKAMENTMVILIWGMVALHVTGVLPAMAEWLDSLSFGTGARRISVLLVFQALVMALLTLIATLWVGRIIENRLMRAEQIDLNLRVVLSKLLRVALILVGVLAALSAVGFDITLLSVFGGALGVGLGFGLQKIASNYVSGFIILLDHSLHLGDMITVDGHYGEVTQLRARYLVLKKLDGTEVVIPNDTLITSTVINHSFSDRKARVLVPLQISYNSSLDMAMQIMREAARSHPRVLEDPAPDVQVVGLGENGIDLQLVLWVNDPEEGFGGLKSAIYLKVLQEFHDKGIVIPYPQREIRML